MSKIVIISCTARPNSNTLKVSRIYQKLLSEKGVPFDFLDLRSMPEDFFESVLHETKNKKMEDLIAEKIKPNSAFIFVVPEYNGGFPGVLKLFIDSVHPRDWNFKNACLVGVSTGRAGNLRGMEHLTGILNYLKIHVHYNKLPISNVEALIGTDDHFNNNVQQKVCEEQINGFLASLKL